MNSYPTPWEWKPSLPCPNHLLKDLTSHYHPFYFEADITHFVAQSGIEFHTPSDPSASFIWDYSGSKPNLSSFDLLILYLSNLAKEIRSKDIVYDYINVLSLFFCPFFSFDSFRKIVTNYFYKFIDSFNLP